MDPTSIRIEFATFALIIRLNPDTNEVMVVREELTKDEDKQHLMVVYSELIVQGPSGDWYCDCENPFGPGRMLNSSEITACVFCGARAPWLVSNPPAE